MAVDSSGNACVTGSTISLDFPTVHVLQPQLNNSSDAFAAKLNSTGTALIYSTFLGGSDDESGLGIAVDSFGAACVTGNTQSTNFPTRPGAFQPAYGGQGELDQTIGDAFVTKISESSPFDLCVQDDTSGSRIQFNSATGEYVMNNCGSLTLSGTGTITKKGCMLTLQDTRPDR